MPSTYKTPGVYIEEISTLPASIAQVETAIPAFVGFTEYHKKNGKLINNKPTRITSLLEYQEYFGAGPDDLDINVALNTDNSVDAVEFTSTFCLYDSMRMFFSNGGGPCYIVSVGKYDATAGDYFDDLTTGLETLRKEDEPTLILFPDAVYLSTANKSNLGTLQKEALKQCNDLQDRFCIFDLLNGDLELNDSSADSDGETPDLAFRNSVGVQYLKYGASYYPNLKTTLSFDFGYENVKEYITKNGIGVSLSAISADGTYVDHFNNVLADEESFDDYYSDPTSDASFPATLDVTPINSYGINEGFDVIVESSAANGTKKELQQKARYIQYMIQGFVTLNGNLTDIEGEDGADNDLKANHDRTIAIAGKPNYTIMEEYIRKLYDYDISYTVDNGSSYSALGIVTSTGINVVYDSINFSVEDIAENTDVYGAAGSVGTIVERAQPYFQELYEDVLSYIKSFMAEIDLRKENLELLLQESNPIYANIVKAINKEGIVLPPSAAIAGVYAATDNERGVWVAPANRSLNSVVGPKINITAQDQEGLNVDVTAGKSINAIRSFTGKGTLIWGARTLAGNSNEWRYVPVRRLFNMIEESVKKATEFVVFEPNDKNTWVRTKAMIENFLNQIWKAGGLAGAKAEHAYIVKIGLGETMTAQDILEGRMIVEIHLAAVRPAEFIILKFMHKLQES